MGERIFDCGVCCGVVIFKNEVVPDKIGDGSGPLDVLVRRGVIDEQGESGGGEGFACAAAVKEC